jgi:hypothetical protein
VVDGSAMRPVTATVTGRPTTDEATALYAGQTARTGIQLSMGRSLTLFHDGTQLGTVSGSSGTFPMLRGPGTYRLVHEFDGSALLAVSTKAHTAWTFRSAEPAGTAPVAVPLLSVDYALPLDAANHPGSGAARFTVRQAVGVAAQRVTSFMLAVPVDDGTQWTDVPVHRDGADSFVAQLPKAATGQAVSLRIAAAADDGSGFE